MKTPESIKYTLRQNHNQSNDLDHIGESIVKSGLIFRLIELMCQKSSHQLDIELNISEFFCHFFSFENEAVQAFVFSDLFLSEFVKVFYQVRDFSVFGSLSYALGILVYLTEDSIKMLESKNFFKIYFKALKNHFYDSDDLVSTQGIIYFLQNYYFINNKLSIYHT